MCQDDTETVVEKKPQLCWNYFSRFANGYELSLLTKAFKINSQTHCPELRYSKMIKTIFLRSIYTKCIQDLIKYEMFSLNDATIIMCFSKRLWIEFVRNVFMYTNIEIIIVLLWRHEAIWRASRLKIYNIQKRSVRERVVAFRLSLSHTVIISFTKQWKHII